MRMKRCSISHPELKTMGKIVLICMHAYCQILLSATEPLHTDATTSQCTYLQHSPSMG
jgi:hypothetical protein